MLEGFVRRRVQISLYVFIPLFFVLFAFGPAYIVFAIFSRYPSFSDPAWFQESVRYAHLTLITGIVTAGVAGLLIAYALLQPIKRLKEGLQAISLGDLTTRLALEASREFEHLGRDFNLMVTALNRYLLGVIGGVITVNREGMILSLNPIAELILGYRTSEVKGQSVRDLKVAGLATDRLLELIQETLARQKPVATQELPLIVQEGQPVSLSVSTSPLRDQQGIVIGAVIQFKDLVRLRQVQDQMRRTDRLASLGMLAAGVAHEVRNPLGSIKGLVQLLSEDLQDAQKRRYAEIIVLEVDRLNRVVEDLLKFAQPSGSELKKARLNDLVRQAAMLAGFEKMKKEITLREEYGDQIPEMAMDGERLVQAFLNILLNAIQAISESGEVWVKTALLRNYAPVCKRSSGSDGASAGNQPPDSIAVVEIGNTGLVIQANDLKKIFDPFYTTKEQGTGLGLTIAHQIITAHGGEIEVKSGHDKTVFTIGLPVK